MIYINREKKVIENIPHQLRMWSPFKAASHAVETLSVAELPLYRHGYTRICYLADPEMWLQEMYLNDTAPNEDTRSFEDWWTEKQCSHPEWRELRPLIAETRDEDGVCEAEIVVDAHKIADWAVPIARALELKLREDWRELIPTISTAPADSLVTFKSPMNGSTFYNKYGGDIEDWRAMEGRAFVVA